MEIRNIDNIDYIVFKVTGNSDRYLNENGILIRIKWLNYEDAVRFMNESAAKSLILKLTNDLGIK
jgi:hypothetical protein